MKKAPVVDPNAAFPNQTSEPNDHELKLALGVAFAPIGEIFATLRTLCPRGTYAWQYSPQSGWYRLALLKKRRLFYVIPKRGGFQLMLILGGKAITSLRAGPHASEVERLLKTARRYPEGTAFRFDRQSCDPKIITALLAAKIAHQLPERSSLPSHDSHRSAQP